MKKSLLAILLMVAVLLGTTTALATADTQTQEIEAEDLVDYLPGAEDDAEYDGYIVGVKEDGGWFSSTTVEPDLEEVMDGVYYADTLEDIADTLTADQIDYIEPDYTLTLTEVTGDPLASGQWYLDNLNASSAWDRDLDGAGVKVAVIDSGVRATHEDLNSSRVLKGWNFVDDNSDTSDTYGHGTQVAGIIAAVRDNGVGIAGLADGVQIVPLKAFNDANGKMSAVVNAIEAAVDTYDCQVINMSFSAESPSRTLQRMVTYASEQGVIMIAAVGNSRGTGLEYPAACDEVIGVGAIDANGNHCDFSQVNESVFVTAPGSSIRSLSCTADNEYTSSSGTSFSSPMVAAAAAMAKAYDPDMTDAQFRQLLIDTVDDLGAKGYDYTYGHGALNLENLAVALTGIPVEETTPETTPETTEPEAESNGRKYQMTDIDGHPDIDSIYFALDMGILLGVSDTEFGPEQNMTRAMYVTVLGRLYEKLGGTVPEIDAGFIDLEPGEYYERYVGWAQYNGIIQGYDGLNFGPKDNITREQAAEIMYKYMQYTGDTVSALSMASTGSAYSDYSSISDWALPAMNWGITNGIVVGPTSTHLLPSELVDRAEVTAIIHRYVLSTQ